MDVFDSISTLSVIIHWLKANSSFNPFQQEPELLFQHQAKKKCFAELSGLEHAAPVARTAVMS